MNIILVGKFRGKPVRYQFGGDRIPLFLCSLVFAVFVGLLVSLGYNVGIINGESAELAGLQERIKLQKELINKTRLSAQSDMDALMARIGLMQANVTRLNAMGERLVAV